MLNECPNCGFITDNWKKSKKVGHNLCAKCQEIFLNNMVGDQDLLTDEVVDSEITRGFMPQVTIPKGK